MIPGTPVLCQLQGCNTSEGFCPGPPRSSDALTWVSVVLSSDEFKRGKLRNWQAQMNLQVNDLVVYVCALLSYLVLFQEWLPSCAVVALFSNLLKDACQLLDTQKKTVTWALSHKPYPQVSSHTQKRNSGQQKDISEKVLLEQKFGGD